jgi:hypothetical protein
LREYFSTELLAPSSQEIAVFCFPGDHPRPDMAAEAFMRMAVSRKRATLSPEERRSCSPRRHLRPQGQNQDRPRSRHGDRFSEGRLPCELPAQRPHPADGNGTA